MRRAIVVGLLVLTACGDAGKATPREPAAASSPSPRARAESENQKPKRFDELTLTLELEKTTIEPNGEIASTLVIENNSGEPVTDPMCWLSASSTGLVPVDDPDAELGFEIVVDCSGPHTMGVGYKDSWMGPDFYARTIQGDPLPPGEYYAAFEIQGLSERILVPVTIEAG